MQPIDVLARLNQTRCLDIARMADDSEAMDAMSMLGEFNQCFVGLANFVGQTPWEWHPDDELLFLLEGQVAVDILPTAGPVQTRELGRGEMFTVPARCWHRQRATDGVRLMFITSREGNQVSTAAEPREDHAVAASVMQDAAKS